ncbi:MAG: glycosyltransferase family 4 protein [Planctomycetaceae bacterium]|jgi:glycosyltransferase involved in cell wall biosynthesis|nr:glycosyltransferase family 4 protein [Planctomycetaceae bacterium]MBT4724555.1 glycosyltransferase family 4 protein [Planctomycetaceae bacterium]MBT5124120.1 glycosyltransferase family 4 protein [Planctomycetaceae bacterium]MBT5598929.1 glycosyltransferase family 4 protein [Planctomycetaceae bacterium]MBT5886126.1 glycosyltransferase family 4 protein [Planctomycetaceae bacterium]
MLRVAYLCEYTTVNGGENSLLTFLATAAESIQTIVLCPSEGSLVEKLRTQGIQCVPFDVRDRSGQRKSLEQIVAELCALVERLDVDIVHGNSLSMSRILGAAEDLNCATVGHVRDIMKVSAKVISDLNKVDMLIAVSAATRLALIEQGVQAERVTKVFNGINAHVFCKTTNDCGNGDSNKTWRQKMGLSSDAVLIGGVGQIGLRKGWPVLCDAVEKIIEDFPELHLVIAGERYSQKQESSDYEKSLAGRAISGPLAGRLHWVGYVAAMPEFLRQINVLAHPALQEPLGRVLLEAAASQTPVVATNVGGTTEIFGDHAALLVGASDVDGLATALRDTLLDPEAASERAVLAKERIGRLFSIREFHDSILQVYRLALRYALAE